MNTAESVAAILLMVVLGIVGIFLCAGKGSFLLGSVRDMENGTKKTFATRVFGILLIVIDVILAVVVLDR